MKIRRLGPADQNACVELSRDRGWLPQARQWALMLTESEVFGIDAPDGDGLAGTAVLTRYGESAAIGMMLVASRYGRRGLGRELLEHALSAAGQVPVFLTATAMGRPLYARLGFGYVRRSAKYIGTFTGEPEPASRTRAASDDDMPAILQVDKAAFGADRGFLLRALARTQGTRIRVLPDGSGYAVMWDAGDTLTVGPVVAPTARAARWLIADLAARAGRDIRIDIDPDNTDLPDWLTGNGVPRAGETAFMVRPPAAPPPGGPVSLAGDPAACGLYALMSPAVG